MHKHELSKCETNTVGRAAVVEEGRTNPQSGAALPFILDFFTLLGELCGGHARAHARSHLTWYHDVARVYQAEPVVADDVSDAFCIDNRG